MSYRQVKIHWSFTVFQSFTCHFFSDWSQDGNNLSLRFFIFHLFPSESIYLFVCFTFTVLDVIQTKYCVIWPYAITFSIYLSTSVIENWSEQILSKFLSTK